LADYNESGWSREIDKDTMESSDRPRARWGTPKTILIADDSDTVRGVIREALERETAFKVYEAIDGADAVSKAKELKPNLVILDVRMPHLNGIEAAAILRNSMPKTRIVLISMYDDAVAEKLISTLHVDAVLSKSSGIAKLIERVESLLADQSRPPAG
jgi:DNA-binding NarL/FixJ family response regulator